MNQQTDTLILYLVVDWPVGFVFIVLFQDDNVELLCEEKEIDVLGVVVELLKILNESTDRYSDIIPGG